MRYENRCLQIPQQTFRFSLARCRVLVCEHLDQTLTVHFGHHMLGKYDATGQPLGLPHQGKRAYPAKRTAMLRADARRDLETEERKKNQKRKKRAA